MFKVAHEFKSMGKVAGSLQINDHGASMILNLIISKNNSIYLGSP